MYFILTLFFASLIGITFMIGRKLVLLQNGQISYKEYAPYRGMHMEELKYIILKGIKRYGFITLVALIRLYVKVSSVIKNVYENTKDQVKSFFSKRLNANPTEKREVNKFLRMVSEYKLKLRMIKERVKEEEENL
jgi:hypothetical protein